ncbi:hypothetical protein AZF37_00070 [endosymbiont 'TC1' of Trimyema compressum]|uniref:hypothetical protein n=1 Tax=endosymbiont 'TC1' of Trimyema compressum TaxID=243899 RepID=UPI0007F0894C|nr:hypothetical protein [endosymbiont 'TC1' of Trimyema compressum]AMP19780.1 hypothetical protein AZF37_00070 [endosymbiont 'TC1' of Trimyema compressum]
MTWKSEKVSEILFTSNGTNFQKLSAYPFHLAADPFDNPEYPATYWTPANFALGHKIELTYYYNQSGTIDSIYTVNFESNGGSPVQAIENVDECTLIVAPDAPYSQRA